MNKKCQYLTAFLCCLLVWQSFAYSQVSQEWAVRYDGPAWGNRYDWASAIAIDNKGNVYITGTSAGFATPLDYATVKYNSAGVQQWVSRMGYGRAKSIVVDNSGNVYVTGWKQLNSQGTLFQFTTIKYDSLGLELWNVSYGGDVNTDDRANSLAIDNYGNVYITGQSKGTEGNYDFVTIKYDANGNQIWANRLNGTGNGDDIPNSIKVDIAGNSYVTGSSYGNNSGNDYLTIKYSASGLLMWMQRYDGPAKAEDTAHSISLDLQNNVLVTGSSAGVNTDLDYATLKYSSSGALQWAARYNGLANLTDAASFVSSDAAGNVIVTGYSYVNNAGYDFATVKYNSAGIQQWVSGYNGPGNKDDKAYALVVDGVGNIYVTGSSNPFFSALDYATIKYDPSGNQLWLLRYEGGMRSNVPVGIVLDANSNVYITGWSWKTSTNPDYLTVKYSQLTGINPVSASIPNSFSLYQNYPNPFNPSTNIKFDIPAHGLSNSTNVKLGISDALGREVGVLVNEQLKPGSYEIQWNSSNQPSGVYFYTLIAGDFRNTKRMVLLK